MQYSNFTWRDGQPYSETFDDIYYSSGENEQVSGEGEFRHVFFKNNGLPERWHENRDFVIAELGFGSGLNCLLTIREWLRHLAECKQDKCLHYIAIEKYPLSPDAIVELISQYPELKEYCDELVDDYPPAVNASHSRHLFNNRVVIHYKFMDAFDALKDENLKVDVWYLDGFSPAKNADMWSAKLFEKIAQNSFSGTSCSTYTSAGFVKRHLQQNGFTVNKVQGYANKREMLVAQYSGDEISLSHYVDEPWYCLPKKYKVIDKQATVIGAGIAGLCVAFSLIKRGWSVTIIDKHGDVAKETSANPAAIVYPRLSVNNDIDTEFYTAAYCYSLYVLKKLQDKYREKFWFNDGLLQLLDKKRAFQILDKFQFNHDYVAILNDLPDGLVNPAAGLDDDRVYVDYASAGVVLPESLCEVIKKECGARLNIGHAKIDAIKRVDNRWHCMSENTLIASSEVVVTANGIAVNDLLLHAPLPIEKVRGQVAVFNEKPLSESIIKAVNADKYITPAIQNKHYLGATYARDNASLEIDADDNRDLLAAIDRMQPGVFDMEDYCDAWVGFRSMSKDRCPIVGLLPDEGFFKQAYADICHGNNNKEYPLAQYHNGLYVSAAHGSRGFTSCFLSAEIIAAQVTGEPMPVSKRLVDYLSPSRFMVNDFKRR